MTEEQMHGLFDAHFTVTWTNETASRARRDCSNVLAVYEGKLEPGAHICIVHVRAPGLRGYLGHMEAFFKSDGTLGWRPEVDVDIGAGRTF